MLGALPTLFGSGSGILAPLFQAGREVRECDLLNDAPADEPLPPHMPARSVVGFPVRRRDGRAIGGLLVGSRRRAAFDDTVTGAIRSMAHLLGIGIGNARLAAAQHRERRMAAESAVTMGTVLESVGSGVCVVDMDGILRLTNKVEITTQNHGFAVSIDSLPGEQRGYRSRDQRKTLQHARQKRPQHFETT